MSESERGGAGQVDGADAGDLGGAAGAGEPGASERTRLGELYGEDPGAVPGATPSVERSDRDSGAPAPAVRVVRGDPDPIELAALIAGLTAAAASIPDEEEERRIRQRWSDRSHALRGGDRGLLPRPGHNAWRWSLHP
ncbi:acyl-CoA carboxylase subunit epsilon [Serinibacter salmoneus]|uniref:Acyl-CoA carboxylase epsilon subunit-like protein n=1 Tax=Serinibacter salmoneus TaxID=556530 RepID=A0A2A9D3G4_9MICO|nr:acyl-CoA carboxylase subunit epsilon [Serinibacter salmoneus]PFG20379.1 acyl-CoA carboxylase epsilon subunit-like protein [Serinibacter salmoneus]